MRVAVAFDHRGVKLRPSVLEEVEAAGHETVDLGTDAPEPRIDYPDKAREVGEAIQSGAAQRPATTRTRPIRASSTTT
jgi:ribose 5-phosphate isomerase B